MSYNPINELQRAHVRLHGAAMTQPSDVFVLFFRVTYLSIFAGHTAFTFLGFSRVGTAIGAIATIVVAVGSEISFVFARREEAERLKEQRYVV